MKKLLSITLTLAGLATPLASAGEMELKIGSKIPNFKMKYEYEFIDSGIISAINKNGDTNRYRIVTLKDPSRSRIFVTYPLCDSKTEKIAPFGLYREGDKKVYLNSKPYDSKGIIDEVLDVEGMNMINYVPKCPIGKIV